MHRNKEISDFWAIIGLAGSIAIPSIGIIHKYFGEIITLFYLPVVFLAIWLIYKFVAVWFQAKVSEKLANWLIVATFLGLTAIFFIMYPIANVQTLGRGSDADDALKIAAQELLQGRYPYYPKTYLGNPIAPLPGAVLLVTPFVLLGEGSLQNIFWLVLFFIVLSIYLKDSCLTLLLLWSLLILCPAVLHNIVTGVDDTSNAIYVLFFSLLLFNTVTKAQSPVWAKLATAILLGISLSSRANFTLLMPLVFYSLVNQTGWLTSAKYALITGLTAAAVTIPFWLYDLAVLHLFTYNIQRLLSSKLSYRIQIS